MRLRSLVRVVLKGVAALVLVVILLVVGGIGWIYWHYAQMVPLAEPQQLMARSVSEGLCPLDGDRRQFVPLAKIPPIVRAAFLTQDPDLFERVPINPFVELARAAWLDRRPRSSSMTESLRRCLMMWRDWRAGDFHIAGAILFWRIERTLPPDVLFALYLNEVTFGDAGKGVVAAGNAFFGKSLPDIGLAEAATLVALSRDSRVFRRRVATGIEWRNQVIDRMAEAGAVTAEQAADAKARPVVLRDASERK